MTTHAQHRSTTREVLAGMMVENTGRHMLDSGGAYGRQWERNQAAVGDGDPVAYFDAQPAAWMSDMGFPLISTYHFLADRLDYDYDTDRRWRMWCRMDGTDRWSANRRYFNSIGTFEEWLEALIERGWAERGEFGTGLTYNHENCLTQDFHWIHFGLTPECPWTDGMDRQMVGINIHGGCDIRGGYTDIRVFSLDSYDGMCSLLDFNAVEVTYRCSNPNAPSPHQLVLDGVPPQQDCPAASSGFIYSRGDEWHDDGYYIDCPVEADEDENGRMTYECPHCPGILTVSGVYAPSPY